MEDRHREAIRKSWTTLVNGMRADQVNDIAAFLLQNNLLTVTHIEEMDCQHSTKAKMVYLLRILMRRGPSAFQALVDALILCKSGSVIDVLLSNA